MLLIVLHIVARIVSYRVLTKAYGYEWLISLIVLYVRLDSLYYKWRIYNEEAVICILALALYGVDVASMRLCANGAGGVDYE